MGYSTILIPHTKYSVKHNIIIRYMSILKINKLIGLIPFNQKTKNPYRSVDQQGLD